MRPQHEVGIVEDSTSSGCQEQAPTELLQKEAQLFSKQGLEYVFGVAASVKELHSVKEQRRGDGDGLQLASINRQLFQQRIVMHKHA